MKLLWVTNIPVGQAGKAFFGKPSSGLWMDAELACFQGSNEHTVVVVTSGETESVKQYDDGCIRYYLTPDKIGYHYKAGNPKNIAAIRELLQKEQPDIIHVWGTECEIALDVLSCKNQNTPAVVFIQGVVSSISRYFNAGIERHELKGCFSLYDLLTGSSITSQKKRYQKRAKSEQKILEMAHHVISENRWSVAYCLGADPNVVAHYCPLNINTTFANRQWSLNSAKRHTIMCNSSNYSIKGLHMLLKAMDLVKKRCPSVHLFVPGGNPAGKQGWKNRLRRSGYICYLVKLIRLLNLQSNVTFLDFLTPEQMGDYMQQSHIFVVPSAIENHSSSLKEAMLVGVPCISSNVGGVPEYARHEQNALLYRFEEPEVLADHILRIFEDDKLAETLSQNAKKDMTKLHVEYDIHARMLEIYQEILG